MIKLLGKIVKYAIIAIEIIKTVIDHLEKSPKKLN